MKAWLADSTFRSVLRNASYLGVAKLLSAPMGLLALAWAGRALGPAMFGILMVIHTYAMSVGAIAKFQTWQFILRFGAPAMERGDRALARDAIRVAFGVDLLSGLSGLIVGVALLPFLGQWLGLDKAHLHLAMLYCTLVPTMSAGTATGILRLLDRFDLIGAQQLVTPLLRALGAGVSFFGDLGFIGFLITWYAADLCGDLVLWGMAFRELHRREMVGSLRPGLVRTARALPGTWGFIWTTNFAHSLYSAWGPLGNLIVAGLLGPSAAGIYKIAANLLDATSKPADLFARSFYPEIMRLDPGSRDPWRLGLRMGLIAAGIGLTVMLVILLGGKPVIGLLFGAKYLDAYDLLKLMGVSLIISMGGFPLQSLLHMVGRQRAALMADIAAVGIYVGALYLLATHFGLMGAGLAFVIGSLANTLGLLILTLASYRARARYARITDLPTS